MYKIIFEDNNIYLGGNLLDSKWNEMPLKSIKKLEYPFLSKTIIMENFESYNHLIERVVSLNGKSQITKIILLGLFNNKIYKIIIDLKLKKILKEITNFGEEYNNKSTTGWKKGILGKSPYLFIK